MIITDKLKPIEAFIVAIFSLTCFIMAGYMTSQQFKEYSSNQDFTIISRSAFVGEKDDLYPAVSICLNAKSGSKVFKRPIDKRIRGLSSAPFCKKEYNNSGNIDMVACGPEDYFLAMSGQIENTNITALPFEWMAYDAREFVLEHNTMTREGEKSSELCSLLENGSMSGLLRNYQDPRHICFVKKQKFESTKLLRYQYWEINMTDILSTGSEYDIRIFVHQKGHLLRNLGAPNFVVDDEFLKNEQKQVNGGFTYKLSLTVNAVNVLRKRKDSPKPCNDTLYDEDTVWIQNVIRQLNCTPPFFKEVESTFGINKTYVTNVACKKEKLFEFHSKYAPDLHFETIARFYDPPCTEMESIVGLTTEIRLR